METELLCRIFRRTRRAMALRLDGRIQDAMRAEREVDDMLDEATDREAAESVRTDCETGASESEALASARELN